MSVLNFNKESEKEVSSGAIIGYVLAGFAVVIVIAFIIFACATKIGKKNAPTNNTVTVEQTVEDSTSEK